MGGEILTALVTSFLVPALHVMWKRRYESNPEAAEGLIWGLLMLGAGIVALIVIFRLADPVEGFMEVLRILLYLLLLCITFYGILGGILFSWMSIQGMAKKADESNM